jgi:hypothetical protein
MDYLTPGSVTLESPWPEAGCHLCGMSDDGEVLYCDHLQLLHDRAGLAADEVTGIDMGDSCARCGYNLLGAKIVYCDACVENFPGEVAEIEERRQREYQLWAAEQDRARDAGELPPFPVVEPTEEDSIPF